MINSSNRPIHSESLFKFLSDFARTYGGRIEREVVSNDHETGSSDEAFNLGRIFEELLQTLVASISTQLGDTWTITKEQGNGQPAFESKSVPSRKSKENVSNDSLAGMFSFVTICMDACPLFLFHLPARPRLEPKDDMLLRRAVESAVVSLNDCNPFVAGHAMKLLTAVFTSSMSLRRQNALQQQADATNQPNYDELCAFLSDAISRSRLTIIRSLLLGCCGKMNRGLIGDAAELFVAILQVSSIKDAEANIVSALHQDFFLLGDPARNASLAVFGRSTDRTAKSTELASFLEELWELHQVEDAGALPSSDAVAGFLRKYNYIND